MIKDNFFYKIRILFVLCIITFYTNHPIYAKTSKFNEEDLKFLESLGFTFPPISTECTQKNMAIPQNIREFVMHNNGYHNVEYVGKWKGYQVYQGIFCDNVTHYRGYPQYTLYRNNELRWANYITQENMEIYRYFLSKRH